ncbi:MAG: thioredoxin-dependent thiol peroxidase [Bacteroidetes bacterium]|nr:thioredoxin-dependent thiol peroxidase [Bacteroidota bacterium]
MLSVGDRAPDFTLPAVDGSMFSLKEHRGKKVVLYFYPKDNTPGCTKEACSFRDTHATIAKRNAIVVGISADSNESHKRFAEKYQLPFLLLSDAGKEVVRLYGVWKQKRLYGKTTYGIERTTFIIDEDGIIKGIFRKVDVENHIQEVLSVL